MKRQNLLMALLLTALMFTACQKDSGVVTNPEISQKLADLKVQMTENGMSTDVIEEVLLSVENTENNKTESVEIPDELARMVESGEVDSRSCPDAIGLIQASTTMRFWGFNVSDSPLMLFRVQFTPPSGGTTTDYYLEGVGEYFYDFKYLDCGTWTGKIDAFDFTLGCGWENLASKTVTYTDCF